MLRPSKRSPFRRAASLLFPLALSAGLLAWGYHVLLTSPRLAITRVIPIGLPEDRTSALDEAAFPLIGQSILFADIESLTRKLSKEPWVESVSVRRVLPDALEVRLKARAAVALARLGDELWTVDANGVGLWRYTRSTPGEDLVLVDPGPDFKDTDRMERAMRFLGRLREEDKDLLARVSELEVRGGRGSLGRSLVVFDRLLRARLHFGEDALEPGRAALTWRALLATVPELSRHGLSLQDIDLRFADRIVLRAPDIEATHGKT